ncbi:MAG TPA: DNA polymerase/3'-5' exonuclease PolX [Candidatus Binatia bacterium]|nr:DNA polymerase/3'-5' exonuclease PolX [Candidatus Binatia bacterium]
MRERFDIAADLRKIARLLEIKGENPFKTQAYERGASAIENYQGDFDALVKTGRLKEIPGIGNALAALIEEIYRTGECWMLQQLLEGMPPGAMELSTVRGLNLKKIIALNDTLGIESVADLKTACQEGLVSKVKGFGLKSQAKLLADIESLQIPKDGSLLLSHALETAQRILLHLRVGPELIEADLAGALRRRKETVRRICVVAASNQPGAVLDRFLRFPALAHTDELDDSRCIARLTEGVKAELIVVAPENYTATLHAQTGSRRHITKLQDLARSKAMSVYPEASNGVGRQTDIRSETDIYRRLGLQYIPPEMREDEGEVELASAGKLTQPVKLTDIRGMTHCHTIYSDGRNSIEEMALAAEAMGMTYLTITDHSPSAHYARGVGMDHLRAQWDEIARVQQRVNIKLLKGTESDILEDGSLDYPDHLLAQFDIIIASIHSRHRMDSEQMTERLLRALKLPFFKIWGHPLGRLIGSRPPLECRMNQVLDAIAESKCAIEVNGDPRRLDLEPDWIRAARTRGIKFIVSTDAHSTGSLANLHYGVSIARRGWLTRGEVLNSLDAEDFIQAIHP